MILVSILGDFHSSILPIFYNFKDKINTHVLINDDSKKDMQNAKNISKGIHKFIKKNNYSFLELNYKLDEDSKDALDRCAKYILALTSNPRDIYINTTDGYSTLTTILNHKLFKHGVNFLAYDMYDNQYNILNKDGLVTKNMDYNLNITNHFLLKGYKTEKSTLKEFAEKNKKNIKKIFEKMSDKYNDFIKLSPEIYPTIADLRGKHEDIQKIFLEIDTKFSTLSINNALLTGTLFECYVYLIVKNLDYDDIEIGMEVFKQYKNSYIRNEFDILIMKNNHLHMIECKFKNFIKVDELVYKYMALANTIDEDGKMAIVTKKPPHYDDSIDNHQTKGLSYKRGRLSNIYFYGNVHNNKTKFQKEIKELFEI
jgi:hypothetical protein